MVSLTGEAVQGPFSVFLHPVPVEWREQARAYGHGVAGAMPRHIERVAIGLICTALSNREDLGCGGNGPGEDCPGCAVLMVGFDRLATEEIGKIFEVGRLYSVLFKGEAGGGSFFSWFYQWTEEIGYHGMLDRADLLGARF